MVCVRASESFPLAESAENAEIFCGLVIAKRQFGLFKLGTMDVSVKQGEVNLIFVNAR